MIMLLIGSLTASGAAQANVDIPETILVRVTGEKRCSPDLDWHWETIDFKEYVKGVLGNEWHTKWEFDSLVAGAVAVKMFAWSWIEQRGWVWDCNWSQVYWPATKTLKISAAVDYSWDIVMLDGDGDPIRAYYDDHYSTCVSRGQPGRCMGQWDSKDDAESGMNWDEILAKYYPEATILWWGFTQATPEPPKTPEPSPIDEMWNIKGIP